MEKISLKDKRVLVTGAAGFIGSHLVEQLIGQCAHLRAFVRYNARADTGNLAFIPEDKLRDVELYRGDICESETTRKAMQDIDIVFNLAALVGIPYSYKHPEEVFDVNLQGALNIMIAARDLGVEKVVQTSTSEVYGTAQYVPMDEAHPKHPQSPYAASKVGADALTLSFQRTYGVPAAVIRPFNTYGPRQSERAVIPTIIAQILSGDALTLGTTSTTRDFNFVRDTVDGFISIAKAPEAVGQEINIGSGKEISIADIITLVSEIVGKTVEVREDEERMRPQASEVRRLLADNSRAAELVGWSPKTPLREGLSETVEWVRARLDSFGAGQYRI